MTSKRPSNTHPCGLEPAFVALRRHRLWPVLLALWSAVLLGAGSLAVSPGLLERVVVQFGLPNLIPAAAPPLGTTARLLLAVAMAICGGSLGSTIGWLSRLLPPVAAPVAKPVRVRTIRPVESDEHHEPLAGAVDPAAVDTSNEVLAIQPCDVPIRAPRVDFEPIIAPRPDIPVPGDVCDNSIIGHEFARGLPATAAPRIRARDAHPDAAPRRPLIVTEDLLPEDFLDIATLPDDQGLPLLSGGEDRVPVPISFAPEPDRAAAQAPQPAPAPANAAAVAPEVAPAEPAVVNPVACNAASPDGLTGQLRLPIATAPLETLGMVELIERLALAITQRQTLRAARIAAPPSGPVADPDVEASAVADDEGPRIVSARFGLGAGERDGPHPGIDGAVTEAVVPFPGQPTRSTASGHDDALSHGLPGSADDPDRALRAALATLRRMTGKR